MHTIAATIDDEHNGLIGTEAQPEEMERKPQSGLSIASVVIAALSLVVGVMGGLLVSVSSYSDRMARMETRMQTLEDRGKEERQTWEYIRAQNETMRSSLAKIEERLSGKR